VKVRECAVRLIKGQMMSSDCMSASSCILVRGEGREAARSPSTHMRRRGKLGPLLPALQQGGRAGFYTIGMRQLQDKYAMMSE